MKQFNSIIRLRKDTALNYSAIGDVFVPMNGEACIVVGNDNRLRVKIGDGVTKFNSLSYGIGSIDDVIVRGYFHNNDFYTDSSYTVLCEKSEHKLYIDSNKYGQIYTYDGTVFVPFVDMIPNASDAAAGIAKLYSEMGDNQDGSVSQKGITDEMRKKIECKIDETDEEMLILFTDLY